MNPDKLKEIQERCEQATAGPWAAVTYGDKGPNEYIGVSAANTKLKPGRVTIVCRTHNLKDKEKEDLIHMGAKDAEFIAHAREDIPALVNRIEQLEQAARAVVISVLAIPELLSENIKKLSILLKMSEPETGHD